MKKKSKATVSYLKNGKREEIVTGLVFENDTNYRLHFDILFKDNRVVVRVSEESL